MAQQYDRAQLLKVLHLAAPALHAHNYVPALTHFRFNGESVTASDDISAIEIPFETEMQCCIPGQALVNLVSSLTGESVSIKVGKEGAVQLTSAGSRLQLKSLPVDHFPFLMPSTRRAPKIDVTPDILRGISMCLPGVSTDGARPAQCGVTLTTDDQGEGHAVLYSCSGETMSRYVTDTTIKLPDELTAIILPTFFCQQLQKMAKAFSDEALTLYIADGALVFTAGKRAKLLSKVPDDLMPLDYSKQWNRGTVGVKPDDAQPIPVGWDAALHRCIVLQAKQRAPITLKAEGGQLHISCAADLGDIDDAFDWDGAGNECAMNPEHVAAGSKGCTHMAFGKKVLYLTGADGHYTHIIAHYAA